jgi:F-type H+-transporting ATPase subunit delta
MVSRFADALLEYAEENGLEFVYRQALRWVTQFNGQENGAQDGRGTRGRRSDLAAQGGRPEPDDLAERSDIITQDGRAAQYGGGAQDERVIPRLDDITQDDLAAQRAPGGGWLAEPPLGPFLANVPADQREAVLDRFLDIARDRLNLVDAEVVTAVPLRPEQRQQIEIRLIRMFKKQINLTATVDPSLLGGIRVIANDTVIDDSIKRKLSDMKNGIYKGVYASK